MTDKEKIQKLRNCFTETIWMAIRYAHGRHTYAPGMVRDAISEFKEIFPEWEPKEDIVISPPKEEEIGGFSFKGDYLHDLFKSKNPRN
jgi:hypothetical protein